jgi:hypothetical protein
MRGRRFYAPVIALGVFITGCSDVLLDVRDDSLSYGEVAALAAQMGLETLGSAQAQGTSLTGQPSAAAFGAAETVTVSYQLTRPCVLGGTVTSSGTVTVETETDPDRAVVVVHATDVHDACVFLADGSRISITGDPDVTAMIHVATLGEELDGVQSVSIVGAVLWESDDDRNGRCEIDILVEVHPDAERHTARGRFCGHELDVTVTGT